MVKYATYIRLMLVIAVMLIPTSSFAAGAFGDLTKAGNKIFEGLR